MPLTTPELRWEVKDFRCDECSNREAHIEPYLVASPWDLLTDLRPVWTYKWITISNVGRRNLDESLTFCTETCMAVYFDRVIAQYKPPVAT